MKKYNRILVILICMAFGLSVYAASVTGFGIRNVQNESTKREISQNCPDYYTNKNGDCLGRTFRGYYMVRGLRGGGFGSGK